MLYLASRSPRRRQLLAQLGLAFEVVDVDVPEVCGAGEAPLDYVRRVAVAKTRAGHGAVRGRDPRAVVLGADTEVVLDRRVFGKPGDADAAVAMLEALAGRVHRVVSVVCCIGAHAENVAVDESDVRFAALDARAIRRYVDTGEPFGKAGGYAIQGRAAAFVEHLSGSYSGVMGLPLNATARLLAQAGIEV